MRSSSDSIAQLASSLAKAQIELVNPAKTLTGIIDRWGTGNEGQTYRYAPLSAGLDIVRQALCKHELAVIQTTHVDRDTSMVLLTTTLAHGSGEWIAASWPVCRTTDMSDPKLMGAALTYARRYGLFTLVGIAGEDDLDAPELSAPTAPASRVSPTAVGGAKASPEPPPSPAAGGSDRTVSPAVRDVFRAALRAEVPTERLRPMLARTRKRRSDAGVRRGPRRLPSGSLELALGELQRIEDPDTLFEWALRVLPLRSTLPDAARASLDAAFFDKADEVDADIEALLPLEQAGAAQHRPSPALAFSRVEGRWPCNASDHSPVPSGAPSRAGSGRKSCCGRKAGARTAAQG